MPDSLPFFIRGDDGQEYGPVELPELREWVRENRAGLGTNARYDEPGALWQPWQYYPELVALLAEARAAASGLAFAVAPLGKRGLAFLLDFILCCILVSPILAVIQALYMPDWIGEFGRFWANPTEPMTPLFYHYVFVGNLIVYAGLILYMTGFHAAHGKTPGKSLLRLRVVDATGAKPALSKSLIRGILFAVSMNPYVFVFTLFSTFFNPQRRALHDWVAGTMVVQA